MAGEGKGGALSKGLATVDQVTDMLGTLVPTIGAIGGIVRLIATAVRPSDAQQAQLFDAAIAEYDAARAGLDTAIGGFEAAKAALLQGTQASEPSGG